MSIPTTEMVNVLCMKWGTKYPADYVNTLYSMVARNLSREFRFVCLTEDATGLDPKIEAFPLPQIKLDLAGPERGWNCLLYTSPSPRDQRGSRMPSSA